MKKLSLFIATMLTVMSISAQTARVQIIHNSPDDAATSVDIYLDGALAVPALDFRTATEFLDIPADVEIDIDIAPAGSADVSESVANFPLTLADGATYVVVADGITGLSSTTYTPAPAFGLEIYDMGREAAMMAGNTDVLVHHGSTDAPTVDVAEVGVGAGIIVNDASYPGFVDYLPLPTANYALAVQTADNSTTVATYAAPLAALGLEDAAITVVASGFLDPAANGDGPAFGLYVALASGGALVPLPAAVTNDNPCDAIMLPTTGIATVIDNSFATVAAGEDAITPPAGTAANSCQSQDGWCGGDTEIENSVWFMFEAINTSGTITTCADGNTIDSQVALYSATDCTDYATLSLIGANDDVAGGCTSGESGFASTLDFDGLTPGNTYWILVDGYNGDSGELAISVTQSNPSAARVQIIHNSPDDAATAVDIYLNGEILVPGLAFRNATPFVDAPAGVEFDIDIAPAGSVDVSESIATFPLTLAEGATYVVVADGITGLSATEYNPAPAFGLEIFDMGQEAAAMMGNTDVLVHHGSTDAPTVDVVEVGAGAGIIVDDASYTDFAGYLPLATADYVLEVQTADNSTTVATYLAPLAGLGLEDAAITVVASGFLSPADNGDGPAFGLYAALASGGALVPLPVVPANDNPCGAIELPTDGTASVYTNVGAGVAEGEDAITPPAGTDGANSCVSQDGWCGGDAVIQNSVWFSFVATSAGVNITTCSDNNTIDTQLALYSATDCADFGTLTLLGANDDVTDGCGSGSSTFASDLTYCGLIVGNTYWVMVDSYLGEQGDFEISISEVACPARVQVIHNSAEDIAASVDVYIDGALAVPGFEFRTATGFIDLPANQEINIDIAPGGSTDVSESIYNVAVTLDEAGTYVIVADGITGLSAGTYTPSPAFGLQIYDMGREAATAATNTDVLVHHGSTDAPTVDVEEVGAGAGIIVDDISYTEFQGYLELPTADYQLAVQTADNAITVATYEAPLATLALDGAAITVVASGFLDPSVNNDGPAFGLWVATAAGGNLIPLPLVTSLDEFEPIEFSMFPNPANDELTISSAEQIESIAIFDTQGRLVLSEANNIQRIDISSLSEGFYQVAVSVGDRVSTERLVKL